jgi:hypothetical protein
MSHAHGAHLDGVRNIKGIRLRCVCQDNGCWSFRTARGKMMPKGRRHVVWLFGRGPVSVPRAVWELKTGQTIPEGWRAFRTCDSYDCANPKHIDAGPPSDYGKALTARGVFKVNATNARRIGLAQSKLTPELRQWAVESTQSATKAAHGLGVGKSIVATARKRQRDLWQRSAPSVFAYAQAANNGGRQAQ